MRIAIASGKGGTGKTTVSASLARIWDTPLTVLDLDVEEPNLHLFLRPELTETVEAHIEIPVVDEDRCTACRACADLCQFKAITVMAGIPMVFEEMCHGCGGCLSVCPEGALSRGRRLLGEVSSGLAAGNGSDVRYFMGTLRIGEAMSPPLMKIAKKHLAADRLSAGRDVIVDAPPGVSCPAVNAVMDSDAIVMVTEPTPFGLYDLTLAHQSFSHLGKPMGVVINRATIGDSSITGYCRSEGLPIWAEIPFDRAVAEAYSQGRIPVDASDVMREAMLALKENVRAAVLEVCHA